MSFRGTLCTAALWLSASPAGAQIVLPGTQPGDIVNWPLWDSALCGVCHGQYTVQDYEPWETWAGSMMANAARDPLFWAGVDIANQDSPGVGEWCIRCHAPRGWLAGRSSTPDGSALLGSPDSAGGDFEGIDCALCHRLYEGPTGTPFLQNAQYWVDDGTPSQSPPNRGPYTDATFAPHAWQYSAYHRSSALCGVCHNVRNPLVNLRDASGADTGLPFPEQTTYDEWAQSAFPGDGVECQTCHMPAVAGWACSDQYPLRPEVPKHELIGANVWMSTVLKGLYGASLSREAHFDRAINLALDNLQNRSAALSLDAPLRAAAGGVARLRVRVTNLTGHKLPTGYPEGRQMWLHVRVEDAVGQLVYESGAYDSTTAALIEDADIRVYEAVHGVHGEGAGFHLVRNDRILKDNRIPPAGFVPDASTMPVGATFETLPDGTLANWDFAAYSAPIPPAAYSPLRVTASLWYQTASREYIEFLRDENVSGPDPLDPDPMAPSRGEKMWSHWNNYGKSAPVLMAQAARTVRLDLALPVTAPAPPPHVPRIVSVGTNPFRDRTEITFLVPPASGAVLLVFDVAGRRIRTLADEPLAPGRHSRIWDGRTDAGTMAASGSYFVRLDVAGHSPVVERVLLLR
ncbi:MAG: FlgD immunoglobulin-like domain containing protein [Candidatus Eiseniibacteriota bacterium]